MYSFLFPIVLFSNVSLSISNVLDFTAIINKMNSSFSYLFVINSDGYVHNIHNHFKIFSINMLYAIRINLGIPNNSKEYKTSK